MRIKRTQQIGRFFEALSKMRRIILSRKQLLFQKLQLTHQQLELIFLLADSAPATIKDVAEFMNVSSSAATQMIEGLVKLGYVSRVADRKDRRSVQLNLTPKGQKKFGEIKKVHFKKMQYLLQGLTDKEMEVLISLPHKMAEQIIKLKKNH